MTREEEIKRAADIYYGGMYHKYPMEYFTKGAQWADKHPKSPWISVKDRLPEVGDYVLIHTNLNHMFCAKRNNLDEMDGAGFVVPIGYFDYWMPIPELPKGGEE